LHTHLARAALAEKLGRDPTEDELQRFLDLRGGTATTG